LYGISQAVEQFGTSLEDVLHGIAQLLPPAWQYPEIASARIVLDGRSYTTADFREGPQRQSAAIVVNAERRGAVDLFYTEAQRELDEGPFFEEERNLIDTVARQVGLLIRRKEAEEERSQLQEQLVHADRLATIGQLAAGVAHELNEPLGNILGFAQLAGKCEGLPHQASQDVGKIESAALHAREIIRKLLVFARQMPSKKSRVDLNQVLEEGLYFLEARCAKAGIELERSLSPGLPKISADSAHLNQVIVNLVVNGIQAMPGGGKLRIETGISEGYVRLIVEDTGVGMSRETLKQVFVPFFTTKDVGEGTGLGLPVVHGIVSSHGGSIQVESKVGRGTRFEILWPINGPPDSKESKRDGTLG